LTVGAQRKGERFVTIDNPFDESPPPAPAHAWPSTRHRSIGLKRAFGFGIRADLRVHEQSDGGWGAGVGFG
jgi:hypothetical protein